MRFAAACGLYAGELAEVDHIVPIALAPELGNLIPNLELMPQTLNRRKGGKVGVRQLDLAFTEIETNGLRHKLILPDSTVSETFHVSRAQPLNPHYRSKKKQHTLSVLIILRNQQPK